MPSSLVKIATTICLASALANCKDQTTDSATRAFPVSASTPRYYAFKLKAYRDQHGKTKVRKMIGIQWHDVEQRVAVRLSLGNVEDGRGRDNPYLEVRNMDEPADCYQVESRYDPDVDPPIYENNKTHYRQRLNFHAPLALGTAGKANKLFTFLWYAGLKHPDYGIMKRFQIKHTAANKRVTYFLTDSPLRLSPVDIEQRFFSAQADSTCQYERANRPPVRGVWYHALVLPRFKGVGSNKKQLDKSKKIALRLAFSPTKGGGQRVQVIIKDLDNPSSCHAFNKHALTVDWMAHNDKLYHKHISITKKFGDSERYYMITWLQTNKAAGVGGQDKGERGPAHIGYFYLDESTGGSFYEYNPAASATPDLMLSKAEIAKHFPTSDPAAGCTIPKPKRH